MTSPPTADLDGLRAVYSAWCFEVPFDNIRKLITLRTTPDATLPGIVGVEFLERWLTHGVGGTCWPSSNALYELLIALGFEARRVAGSMGDTGIESHGSVIVTCHSRDWLVDTSMLTQSPLPLTEEVFISGETVFVAEVERVDGTHIVWTDLPLNDTYIPCRLLVDPAKYEYYAERYEASRIRSPFNERIYARRNRPGETLVVIGNRRLSKTSSGLKTEELSREGLCDSLREEFGISGELMDEWRRSGALEASFQPPTEASRPVIGLPPSKRGTDGLRCAFQQ